MSDIQKQIKEALEKAEVGPWAKVEFSNGHMEVWQSIDNTGIAKIWGNNETASANAHLIANAPTWLLHQQELIEQLQRELKHSQDNMKMAVSSMGQKDAEIAKLREIQRALVLTPMQKMSRAMEIIDKQKGADT